MTRQPEVAAGRRSSRPNRFDVVLVVALALSVFFQRLDYVLWLEGISDTGRHLRGRRRDPVRTRRVSPSEGLASTHPTEPEGDHAAGISAHRDRDVGGGSCSRRSQGNIAAAAREPDAGRPHHRPGRLPQECHCLFRRHQRNATRTTAAAGCSQVTFNTSSGIPYAVVPGKPYTFSVSVRAARGTPTVRLFLIQRAGGRVVVAAGPVAHISRTRWVRARVTVTTAPRLLTINPVIASAPLPTPGSLSLRDFQLVGAAHPVLSPSSPDATPGLRAHPGQSLKSLLHLAFLVAVALVMGRMLTLPLLRCALVSFFLFSVVAAFVAIAQALDQNLVHVGAADALRLISRRSGGFERPVSIFSEPAYLGYFSLAGAAVGLWLYSLRRERWIAAGIGLCLAAILLAASAGPIVAAVPVLVYMVWRAAPLVRRMWSSLAVVAIAVSCYSRSRRRDRSLSIEHRRSSPGPTVGVAALCHRQSVHHDLGAFPCNGSRTRKCQVLSA